MMRVLSLALLAFSTETVSEGMPGVDNPQRAHVNYILNCQGCHGPEGSGSADGDVPRMKDFLFNFLNFCLWREFLIRVPGVASAPLSDTAIAELLNWTLHTQSPDQIPENFLPYSESDISQWRRKTLGDVAHERERLIIRMR